MKFEKKVSICMMVKNEEKNLPRCLESLKPLLDEGLGELIIIDTGSEDTTPQIARQYTTKVYHHPWNNNFSQMRNISISYARGEWIWIIDADEEVENPQEMVALFKRDLSSYNTLSTTVKNYLKTPLEGKDTPSCISISNRGFRNTGNFHYKGAVHNQPQFQLPILSTDIVMGHYGYIWEDEEFTRKKFERTAGILEKELAKDPQNIYYQFQLAVSWSNIDKAKALEEIRKAYKLVKKLPKRQQPPYLYVHGIYARIAHQNKKHREVITICQEGLEYNKDYIDLWYLAGMALAAVQNYGESLEYLKGFLKLKKNFHKTKLAKDISLTFYHLGKDSEDLARYQLALILEDQQRYDEAFAYVEEMDTSLQKNQILAKTALNSRNYDPLFDYLQEINSDQEIKKAFIQAIEKHSQKREELLPFWEKLLQFYDTVGWEKEPYYLLNKVRVNLAIETSLEESFLQKLLNLPYGELPVFYGDILYYLLKNKVDLSYLASFGVVENIITFLKYVEIKHEDYGEILLAYLKFYPPGEERIKLRYWLVLARHGLLGNKLNDGDYMELFNQYIAGGASYIRKVYHPEVLKEENIYDLKNDEHRFFFYMLLAQKVKESNTREYISYLRKALKIYPLAKGIEELLEEIKKEVAVENTEMAQLQQQFKNNIKILIADGKLTEGEVLIAQYEQIVPNDSEIMAFKSRINLLKGQKASSEQQN